MRVTNKSSLRTAALLGGLAASSAVWAAAQEIPTVDHEPIACFLKDRFARVEATIRPEAAVARARLYFSSGREEQYYAVGLASDGEGRFHTKLPKPKGGAGPVVYFLEVLSSGGELVRTPEVRAQIVRKGKDCPEGSRVAAEAGKGKVDVLGLQVKTHKPRGFKGVRAVVIAPEVLEAAATATGSSEGTAPQVAAAQPPGINAPTGQQEPLAVPLELPAARRASSGPPPQYELGPQDIVNIVVVGHADLTLTVLIQADGTFIFPLLGRVAGTGFTPKQLEALLTEKLGRGFIRNPEVSVNVQEYRSKTVMVMGAVGRPGMYPLSGSLRLMEMLAKAGIGNNAGAEIQIIRPLVPTERPILPAEIGAGNSAETTAQAEILKVDLGAIQRGDLDANIHLRPNDTVFVPAPARFFVSGKARSSGSFPLTPGLTIREAIIVAGGFSEDASPKRTRVIREVDGKKKQRKYDLDSLVQPGDIIVVKAGLF